MHSVYRAARREKARVWRRILVNLEPAEIDAVDAWAVPAGQTSRSEALRMLIQAGLVALRHRSAESPEARP